MSTRLLFACTIALLSFTCPSYAGESEIAKADYLKDKATLMGNPHQKSVPNSILVKFKKTATIETTDQALASVGATSIKKFKLVSGLTHIRNKLDINNTLAALRSNPAVEYAEPDYVQHALQIPNDTYFSLEWGLHNLGQTIQGITGFSDSDIDMPEAWNTTTGGSGCKVAIIDSGVQWSHPDLDANIWSNPGEIAGNGIDDDHNGYIDDVRGWDFSAGDNNPDDENGHGTHVAGTIAAEANNGVGVAGIAWNCKVLPLRFLDASGSGSTADAVSAINYAVAMGFKVSNNSWGGGGYSQALYDAIANARAHNHVFVAAAGNSGLNTDVSSNYPANYNLDNIISVAATDNRDQLASFSNYGLTTVDLGAPGVDIASTYKTSGYVWMSGTSMASPHVTGVVALLQMRNPSTPYSQIINLILSNARPVAALNGKSVTGGVLNANASLAAVTNAAPAVTISTPNNAALFAPGSTINFSGTATDIEDGNVGGSIIWSSNLDGQLGVGASIFTSALSEGTHTITASVTDSGNLVNSKTITVTVTSLSASPTATAVPTVAPTSTPTTVPTATPTTTPATIPLAPNNVTVTNNRNNTATIRWADRSTNETSFQIQRQKRSSTGTWGASTYFVIGANVTSYLNSSGAGTFRYNVRARNGVGNSAWSGFVAVTVTSK